MVTVDGRIWPWSLILPPSIVIWERTKEQHLPGRQWREGEPASMWLTGEPMRCQGGFTNPEELRLQPLKLLQWHIFIQKLLCYSRFGLTHVNGTQRDYQNGARGQKDQVESNGSDMPTHFPPTLPVCAADGKQGELAQCWQQSNTDVQIHVEVLLFIWLWSEMGEFDWSVREWCTNDNWSHVWKNRKQSLFNHYYYFTTEHCESVALGRTDTIWDWHLPRHLIKHDGSVVGGV